jgi:hypothetical protein
MFRLIGDFRCGDGFTMLARAQRQSDQLDGEEKVQRTFVSQAEVVGSAQACLA